MDWFCFRPSCCLILLIALLPSILQLWKRPLDNYFSLRHKFIRSLWSNLLLSAATTTGSPTSTASSTTTGSPTSTASPATTGSPTSTASPTTTGSPTSTASPAGNVGCHEWCGTDRFLLSSVLSSTQNSPARTTLLGGSVKLVCTNECPL